MKLELDTKECTWMSQLQRKNFKQLFANSVMIPKLMVFYFNFPCPRALILIGQLSKLVLKKTLMAFIQLIESAFLRKKIVSFPARL